MSNDENALAPATPFGTAISLRNAEQVANALKDAASKDPRGGAPDGSKYLNFSGKRGVYEFGPDKEDVDSDELWLVNVASFEEGYVCWKGGAPRARRMASIYSPEPVQAPDFEEHGPFDAKRGDGWYQAKALVIKSLDADDRQAYFANNSKSGVSSIAGLQDEIAERLRAGRPYWPIVQLGRETFPAQGYTNSKPVFNIYGWLNDAAVTKLANDPSVDIDDLLDEVEGDTGDAPTGATEKQEEAPKAAARKRGAAPDKKKRPAL